MKLKVEWTKERPEKPGWYALYNDCWPSGIPKFAYFCEDYFDEDEDGLFFCCAWPSGTMRSIEPIEIEVPK